jgi:hypothetical protein
MKVMTPGILTVALLVTSACNNKELTRSGAKEILDKVGAQSSITQVTISFKQVVQAVHLDKNSAQKLTNLLTFKGGKACLPDPSDMRIATGQFVLCPGYIPPDVTWQRPGGIATLNKPITWSISEITGISDDSGSPNAKIVEYTWKYELPEYPKSVAEILNPTPPAKGKSLLRLYDDGWRFVDYK